MKMSENVLFEIKEKKYRFINPSIMNIGSTKKENKTKIRNKNSLIYFTELKKFDRSEKLKRIILSTHKPIYFLLIAAVATMPSYFVKSDNKHKVIYQNLNLTDMNKYMTTLNHSASKEKLGSTLTLMSDSTHDRLPISTWVPYWSWVNGVDNTARNYTAGGDLSAFLLNIKKDGSLDWKASINTEAAMARAHSSDLSLYLTITEDLTGSEFSLLLSDPVKREILINSIVERAAYFDGIDLDFEAMLYSINSDVNYNIYKKYPEFISSLSEKLHKNNKKLIVTLMAGTEYASFSSLNYEEIGKYADKVRLMCYDLHTLSGPALPLSSLTWINSVLDFALSQIDSSKVILGLPTYSHIWRNDGTKASLSGIETYNVIANHPEGVVTTDKSSGMGVLRYKTGKGETTMFYPSFDFIDSATKIALDKKLGGIVLWSVGAESQITWDAINHAKSLY